MIPFTLIGILLILAILCTTIPAIWLIYRYTRPKTEPIKTLLKWETGLASLLFVGTIISVVWPQGCAHPIPAVSSGQPTCIAGSITLEGSSALQSLMQGGAKNYESSCPQASINVKSSTNEATSQGSSDSQIGLDDIENGNVTIGTSDTFAPANLHDLVDHEIAASVFVIIVNSSVHITNLSTSQIQGIYTGKYTNWQELGGPDLTIRPLSRVTGSGTRSTFDTYILGGSELPQSSPIADTQTMISQVRTTQGAIGYADLHDVYVNLQALIPVSIDGVLASPSTVANKSYKFWTIEHMYTKGQATGLTQAFIDYMSNNEIIQSYSFINLHRMTGNALSERCPSSGD